MNEYCPYQKERAKFLALDMQKSYLAVTHVEHPLTGDAVPCAKEIYEETTIKEIIDWHGRDRVIDDLKIVELHDGL